MHQKAHKNSLITTNFTTILLIFDTTILYLFLWKPKSDIPTRNLREFYSGLWVLSLSYRKLNVFREKDSYIIYTKEKSYDMVLWLTIRYVIKMFRILYSK